MSRSKLLLCKGSSCRKALARDARLEKMVAALDVDVSRVGCQKICKGPVVGVRIDGSWEWFARVDTGKAVEALGDLVAEGRLRKRLAKRHVRKRSGRLRG